MDLNVVTDMTAEGRKQTPPSVEKPAYYVAQSTGYRQLGLDSPKEDPLAGVALERLMKNALASAGFLPATADHPATLVLIYHWGSHNNVMNVYERNILLEYSIPDLARSLIERATLVGGEAFAKNLARALEFSSRGEILSFVQGGGVSIVSELGMFLKENSRGDFLAATISGSVYFVAVSAYDFAAMARGGRQLLWRTKMTVSTDGVSMKETLPPLIVSAAPHLGRETNGVETIFQRLSRGGTVTIGDPKVIEYFSAPAAPPSPAPKNPPKP